MLIVPKELKTKSSDTIKSSLIMASALPAHLKPAAMSNDGEGAFARKHHGKSQSHVVS
jgi:hypothetical protein